MSTQVNYLHFLGGPWDGAEIISSASEWIPPTELYVYIFDDLGYVAPRMWDLRTYAAPGTAGPYRARRVVAYEGGYDFYFELEPRRVTA